MKDLLLDLKALGDDVAVRARSGSLGNEPTPPVIAPTPVGSSGAATTARSSSAE